MRVMLKFFGSGAGLALVLLTTAQMVQSHDDGAGTPEARVEGRRIFLRENCYICHGGRGGGGMCPSLREDKPDADDVEEAVQEGTESGMPSYRKRLTKQDIKNLAAYIQSLRTGGEPTFTHWWEPVPTQ